VLPQALPTSILHKTRILNKIHAFPVKTLPFIINNLLQTRLKPAGASFVAIAPKSISPGTVLPLVTPAVSPAIYTESNHLVSDKASPEKDSVSRGTVLLAATKDHHSRVVEVSTAVPYVAPLVTPPSCATSLHDLLPVNTPFIPDEWERLLNNITPFNNFSDVPIGMRFGFDMGVHSPPLLTYTPPNHNSALSYPDHVAAHINNELSLGRYSGPFSRSHLEFLIGPFRTSPLGTVPKTANSTERRIVQDLSFPRNDPNLPSINDQINIEDFRCDWGTFNDVRNIVINTPEGSQAATLDVDSAFRCCPITPSQQRNFVIH
jgi:hypothetical protein